MRCLFAFIPLCLFFFDGLKCWSMFYLDLGFFYVFVAIVSSIIMIILSFETAPSTDAYSIHFGFVCNIKNTKVIRISVYYVSLRPEQSNRKSFTISFVICTIFFCVLVVSFISFFTSMAVLLSIWLNYLNCLFSTSKYTRTKCKHHSSPSSILHGLNLWNMNK